MFLSWFVIPSSSSSSSSSKFNDELLVTVILSLKAPLDVNWQELTHLPWKKHYDDILVCVVPYLQCSLAKAVPFHPVHPTSSISIFKYQVAFPIWFPTNLARLATIKRVAMWKHGSKVPEHCPDISYEKLMTTALVQWMSSPISLFNLGNPVFINLSHIHQSTQARSTNLSALLDTHVAINRKLNWNLARKLYKKLPCSL
jgi:hypothetical protein